MNDRWCSVCKYFDCNIDRYPCNVCIDNYCVKWEHTANHERLLIDEGSD